MSTLEECLTDISSLFSEASYPLCTLPHFSNNLIVPPSFIDDVRFNSTKLALEYTYNKIIKVLKIGEGSIRMLDGSIVVIVAFPTQQLSQQQNLPDFGSDEDITDSESDDDLSLSYIISSLKQIAA